MIGPDTLLLPIRDETDALFAQSQTLALARRLGFGDEQAYAVATAVTELAMNVILHASCPGTLWLGRVAGPQGDGLELRCQDGGAGIADPQRAMIDGYSTNGGLGGGLPGAQRLLDEFGLVSAAGQGTTVTGRKWKTRR